MCITFAQCILFVVTEQCLVMVQVWGLNELEYVESCNAFPNHPVIFANVRSIEVHGLASPVGWLAMKLTWSYVAQVFPKPYIVAIDYATGAVIGEVDMKTMMKRKKGQVASC